MLEWAANPTPPGRRGPSRPMNEDSLLLSLLEQTGALDRAQAERLAAAERNPGEGLVAAAVRLGLAQEEPLLRV